MAVINEMLELAATQAVELAQKADAAGEVLEALVQRAGSLADKVAAESDESHRHFQALLTRLEAAESELEDAGQGAASGLDGLAARAGDLRGRVAGLLAKVRQGAAELDADKERLSAGLAQRVESADDDLEQFAGHLEQVATAAEAHLQASSAAISSFQEAVAAAREQFDDRKDQLIRAMDDLEELARRQTEAYIESVDVALDATADMRVELGNRMLAEHNDAVLKIRERFAEEATQKVAAAIEPLKAAISALAELCSDQEGALRTKAGEVRRRVEEALGLTERIRPVLEKAGELE